MLKNVNIFNVAFLLIRSKKIDSLKKSKVLLLKIKKMDKLKLTLQETIGMVKEFHDAFKIGNEESPKATINKREYLLRYKLMREENEEYLEAAENGNIVEVADALGDMLYILCGTILKHGLQDKIEEVFSEIQRSNMSKLDSDGNPIYREDGKVLKGDLYFRPNIKKILKQ